MKGPKLNKMSKLHMGLIGGGAGFLILNMILAFGGMESIVNTAIEKMVRLVPDGKTWNLWKSLPVPIYMKFTLFNISNAAEMAEKGAKPLLTPMGPYTYLVDPEKYDITLNGDGTEARYREETVYIFIPEMSNGEENDVVTMINVLFVGTAKQATDFTDVGFILESLDEKLTEAGEKLTKTVRVKSLLFDGISAQAYVDLINDPMVQTATDGAVQVPEPIADGRFGLFKGKNGSDNGWWVAKTGLSHYSDFGQLVSWNNKTSLSNWKGKSCNMMNGTDGTIFPPFIKPGETHLQIFASALCRSVHLDFGGMTEAKNVPTARFYLRDFKSVQEDPSLWCFCPEEDPQSCNVTGVAYLGPCLGGAPLLLTKPNFYNTHESIGSTVDGLVADKELHDSFLDIHPLSGSTVQAFIRLQFAIELVPWPDMPSFSNSSHAFIPIVAIEQSAELDDGNVLLLKMTEIMLKSWPILRWILILISLAILGTGAFLLIRKNKQGSTTSAAETAAEIFVQESLQSKVNDSSNNNE